MLHSFSKESVSGKIVLLRGDLNVPMDGGRILDNERLVRLKPTIDQLLVYGAKAIVFMSHFGRPTPGTFDDQYSLRRVAGELSNVLGKPVEFVDDCLAPRDFLKSGGLFLLENLRFFPAEQNNDAEFAQQLAEGMDIYINDAFSCCHRAHASIDAITHVLPSFQGLSLEKELAALESTLTNPKSPVVAITGGSKVSTKLELLNNLIQKVDVLIIGGAMANTFLKAQNINVGESLVENDLLDTAFNILNKAKDANCQIVLPLDVMVGENLSDTTPVAMDVEDIQKGMILDFGPKTTDHITNILSLCETVLWNGPVGAYEFKPYADGSIAIGRAISDLCKAGKIKAIAGGGDTVAVLKMANLMDDMTYVSTAGGAFLEWLEGKSLPGLKALQMPKAA